MEDFVHLHVHTYYSILDGQSSIKKLVDKAVNDGMKGMAITDHGDMFGIKEFHDICNGVNKQRTKEGLGATVKRPGFDESFARKLAEQTGDRLAVPTEK